MSTDITKEIFIEKVNTFLEQNQGKYTQEEIKYIKNNAGCGVYSFFNSDILRQIYAELNLIPPEKNIYLGFIDLLEKNFNINQNIIEIGGGYIPKLAEYLALKQKSGTVTVYDPKLITTQTTIPNLTLKKEKFTKTTPLQDFGLQIALMPCSATELVIRRACENNIDFMVALCSGSEHGGDNYYIYDYDSEQDWESRMIYEAYNCIEKYDLGELRQASLKKYNDPYPVVYNKRRNN